MRINKITFSKEVAICLTHYLMQFHSRENNDVRLEPKSQIDLHSWLDDFFEQAKEENMNDIDACEELRKYGITIDDLREYSKEVYEWAMATEVDW